MNLIIDIGNSRIKAGLSENYELVHSRIYESMDQGTVSALFDEFAGAQACILSSVRKLEAGIIRQLKEISLEFLELGPETALPFQVLYRTRETLGNDRVAGIAGAGHLFPGEDVLVIDCGTAITFDLLEAGSRYLGGNISPGMKMRFLALHNFTEKLPLVDESAGYSIPGTSTPEAIASGVIHGITAETDAFIDNIRTRYPSIRVVGTGGDMNFFAGKLKNAIFVDQNLVLRGLERILNHNVRHS